MTSKTVEQNLANAQVGQSFTVVSISEQQPDTLSRLYALGVFPGAKVDVLRRAPLGDPLQVKVGQTLISLRKQEASSIAVAEAS